MTSPGLQMRSKTETSVTQKVFASDFTTDMIFVYFVAPREKWAGEDRWPPRPPAPPPARQSVFMYSGHVGQ